MLCFRALDDVIERGYLNIAISGTQHWPQSLTFIIFCLQLSANQKKAGLINRWLKGRIAKTPPYRHGQSASSCRFIYCQSYIELLYQSPEKNCGAGNEYDWVPFNIKLIIPRFLHLGTLQWADPSSLLQKATTILWEVGGKFGLVSTNLCALPCGR